MSENHEIMVGWQGENLAFHVCIINHMKMDTIERNRCHVTDDLYKLNIRSINCINFLNHKKRKKDPLNPKSPVTAILKYHLISDPDISLIICIDSYLSLLLNP